MRLIRYEPDFSSIDRLFDEALSAFSRMGGVHSLWGRGIRPAADLYEDSEHYYARIELPGIPKEAVSVRAENGEVSVEVKKEKEGEELEDRFYYNRRFRLPDNVDAEGIHAKLENGILTLVFPKAERAKTRAIEIE